MEVCDMTIYEKLDTLTAGEIRGNLEKFIFIYGEKATKILELEKMYQKYGKEEFQKAAQASGYGFILK